MKLLPVIVAFSAISLAVVVASSAVPENAREAKKFFDKEEKKRPLVVVVDKDKESKEHHVHHRYPSRDSQRPIVIHNQEEYERERPQTIFKKPVIINVPTKDRRRPQRPESKEWDSKSVEVKKKRKHGSEEEHHYHYIDIPRPRPVKKWTPPVKKWEEAKCEESWDVEYTRDEEANSSAAQGLLQVIVNKIIEAL